MTSEMIKGAEFSDCGKFRYVLWRTWDDSKPFVMCIGLNPSVAGKLDKNGMEKDDPTIRTLIKFLTALGYGGLKMVNLYAIVESKSGNLNKYPDKLGNNDAWLKTTAHGVQKVIFCWGAFKGIEHRVKQVKEMFPSAWCFAKTKEGHPIHPMFLMWSGTTIEDIGLIKFEA